MKLNIDKLLGGLHYMHPKNLVDGKYLSAINNVSNEMLIIRLPNIDEYFESILNHCLTALIKSPSLHELERLCRILNKQKIALLIEQGIKQHSNEYIWTTKKLVCVILSYITYGQRLIKQP